MNSARLIDWVQIVTGVAVLVGLILVVWELRQSREASMSQLSSEYYQTTAQHNTSIYGEDASDVLAKACDSPSELSKADFMILSAYYQEIINRLDRMQVLSRRGSFYTEEYWRQRVSQLAVVFKSHAGRAYWKTVAIHYVSPELFAAGNVYLEDLGQPNCDDRYRAWIEAIEESKSTYNDT